MPLALWLLAKKNMKTILNKIIEGYSLEQEEASLVMENIALKNISDAEISSFISLYLNKNLKVEELKGFYDTLMQLSLKPSLFTNEAIDVCGTGGDNKNTFNISTLSAFVIAGAGYKVIKHGNFGVSSSCGSSDLMQYAGYKFTNENDTLNKQLEKTNITFLHAPLFHPALKNIAAIRKDLGVKTFFNLMGPLINPAKPLFRFNGTFSLSLLKQYAYLYDSEKLNYSLIHTLSGYDEISLTEDFINITNGQNRLVEINELGMKYIQPETIFGGETIKESAEIFYSILNNNGTQDQNNVVLVNSAFAIMCIGNCTFEVAFEKAKQSLQNKKALEKFNLLINN